MKKTLNGLFKPDNPMADTRIESVNVVTPHVTLVVTNYNYEQYIIQCLQSIKNQNYKNFSCIIVDDQSTDHSVNAINNFIKENHLEKTFVLIEHSKNSGQAEAFKTGLKKAKGPFIVFVDSDDLLLENFLESHLRIHLNNSQVAFTSSNQYQINENNEIIAGNHASLKTTKEIKHINPCSIVYSTWPWATTSSMVFRKSILDIIIPQDTNAFRICADYYLCLFANLIGESLLIPNVYGCYRLHGNNNYCDNPIIGGQQPPTSNREKNQPKKNIVRNMITDHLIKNKDLFSALLGERGYFFAILRSTTVIEFVRLKMTEEDLFKGQPCFTFTKLLFLHIIRKLIHIFTQSRKLIFSIITF